MNSLVSKLIQKLKRDPNYLLDPAFTPSTLLSVLWERFWQVLRGSYYKLRFKKSSGLLFVGKNVTIRNPQLITTGSNITIKDNVSIQALSRNGIQFGDNVMIGQQTIIECTGVVRKLGEGLKVGNNSNFGDYNFVGVRGFVEIGNDVLFGPRVNIHAEDHVFVHLDIPIRKQGETRQGIRVEDNCWIGSGAIILDGVIIGTGAVVAAGAVVTRDVPPFSIVAGVPARVVQTRASELTKN
jgi:acetyltransferase-like isoleucine patch superfamily enzyme